MPGTILVAAQPCLATLPRHAAPHVGPTPAPLPPCAALHRRGATPARPFAPQPQRLAIRRPPAARRPLLARAEPNPEKFEADNKEYAELSTQIEVSQSIHS